MNRFIVYFLGIIFVFIGSASAVWGCKYSVRDVAFVDLGTQPYLLQFPLSKNGATFVGPLKLALARTNIRFEQVASTEAGPILVAADGRQLKIDFDPGAASQSVAALVSSQLSQRIKQLTLSHHSVVLVVEGSDAANNKRAVQIADESAVAITKALLQLPKPIDKGPVVLKIDAARARKERVALWSLGIDLDQKDKVSIAVIYGRMRRLGPVLKVPPTMTADLIANLNWIGQDCECELDRSWMTGPMMLHQWTQQDEATAVKALDFDPGSPLVRSEIQRILARGPSSAGKRRDRIGEVRPIDPLLGYSEIEIEPTTDQGNTPVAPRRSDGKPVTGDIAKSENDDATASGSRDSNPSGGRGTVASEDGGNSTLPWILIAVAIVIVLVVGVRIMKQTDGTER